MIWRRMLPLSAILPSLLLLSGRVSATFLDDLNITDASIVDQMFVDQLIPELATITRSLSPPTSMITSPPSLKDMFKRELEKRQCVFHTCFQDGTGCGPFGDTCQECCYDEQLTRGYCCTEGQSCVPGNGNGGCQNPQVTVTVTNTVWISTTTTDLSYVTDTGTVTETSTIFSTVVVKETNIDVATHTNIITITSTPKARVKRGGHVATATSMRESKTGAHLAQVTMPSSPNFDKLDLKLQRLGLLVKRVDTDTVTSTVTEIDTTTFGTAVVSTIGATETETTTTTILFTSTEVVGAKTTVQITRTTTVTPPPASVVTEGGKTVTVGGTSTTAPAPAPEPQGNGHGLSTGARIGVGIGASVGGSAFLTVVAFLLWKCWGNRKEKERPFSFHDTQPPMAAAGGVYQNEANKHGPIEGQPTDNRWSTHSPPPQAYSPEPPYQQQYQQQMHQPQLQSHEVWGSQVHEAGGGAVHEMPGTRPTY